MTDQSKIEFTVECPSGFADATLRDVFKIGKETELVHLTEYQGLLYFTLKSTWESFKMITESLENSRVVHTEELE
jgi:hypothetical protein